MKRVSITRLQSMGVGLRPHEAVAIAQQLIQGGERPRADADLKPPFGPPSVSTVYLGLDGRVTCTSCDAALTVMEIGIFLQTLLPLVTPRPSGSLRYTIARAALEVEALPFDSVDELSQALARHERGERTAVIRSVIERARALSRSSERDPAPFERRRSSWSAADFRRELRDADARDFEQQQALGVLTAMTTTRPPLQLKRMTAVTAGLAIAVAIIAAGGTMHVRQLPPPSIAAPAPPPAPSFAALQPLQIPLEPQPLTQQIGTTGDLGPSGQPSPTAARASRVPSRLIAGRTLHRERPAVSRTGRAPSRGGSLLSHMHLRWLRHKVMLRSDKL